MGVFEDKYRRKTPLPEVASSSVMEELRALTVPQIRKASEPYEAFRSSAHPRQNIWVRVSDSNAKPTTAVSYAYRTHMFTDGNGFLISLHYSAPIAITIHGRNLQDLFHKLLESEVEWVQEFDPRKWDVPPDNTPCITGIVIDQTAPVADEKALTH